MKITIELTAHQQKMMTDYAEATFGSQADLSSEPEFHRVIKLRALLGDELRRSALHAFIAAGHYSLNPTEAHEGRQHEN